MALYQLNTMFNLGIYRCAEHKKWHCAIRAGEQAMESNELISILLFQDKPVAQYVMSIFYSIEPRHYWLYIAPALLFFGGAQGTPTCLKLFLVSINIIR